MTQRTISRNAAPVSAAAETWGWFVAFGVLGSLAASSLVSVGWIVLGPVLLAVIVLLSAPTARRSASGLAVGAGVAFLAFALVAPGRPYGPSLLRMGIFLLIAGVAEQARCTLRSPR